MYKFIVDEQYTRKDIYRIIGISEDTHGGNWDTGYNKYINDYFIFANIGVAGRTGHDYGNKFDGDQLVWFTKTDTHLGQPQIKDLLNPTGYVYVFYRMDSLQPFIYAGTGIPISYQDTTPVQITLKIMNDYSDIEISKPEYDLLPEGYKREFSASTYERNPLARKICMDHYGYICVVCSFNFLEKYGEIGDKYIHVHHIKPIYEIKKEYMIDPIEDLRPICPNCHAMIHRHKPALTIESLKNLLK